MSAKTRPCEICNQPIEAERLETVPQTRLCLEHARMIQKFGGEFVVTGTQGSLGKTGSLKRNYGDVSITQTRNNRAIERLRQHLEEGRQE